MPHPQAARLQIRSVVVWLKPWFSTLGSEAPNSKVKEARMYKVLKEICDDKEKMREHEMEALIFFGACVCAIYEATFVCPLCRSTSPGL